MKKYMVCPDCYHFITKLEHSSFRLDFSCPRCHQKKISQFIETECEKMSNDDIEFGFGNIDLDLLGGYNCRSIIEPIESFFATGIESIYGYSPLQRDTKKEKSILKEAKRLLK